MHIKIIKYLFSLFTLLSIAGCAATTFVQKVTPIDTNLSAFKNAYITIKGQDEYIYRKRGFNETEMRFKNVFISDLIQTHTFNYIGDDVPKIPPKDSVVISLVIEDINYLDAVSAALLASNPGGSRLKVLAQIFNANTGKIIGEVRSGAQSSSTFPGANRSTGTLISIIAKKLTDEIATHK